MDSVLKDWEDIDKNQGLKSLKELLNDYKSLVTANILIKGQLMKLH